MADSAVDLEGWVRQEEPVSSVSLAGWAQVPEEPRTPVEIDTRDTDTFTAHMEATFEEEPEAIEPVDVVSEGLREKLVAEEGEKLKVYQGEKDDKGTLTVGIGHKLTEEELKTFSEGDDVTPEQVQAWYEKDSKKALGAAKKQAKEIGADSPEFMSALASVNFQLGTNWKGEHKETWKLMKAGKFEEAAEEAADSEWHGQTPKRVEAFQAALRKEAVVQQYKNLPDGWYLDPDTGERFQVAGGERL